MPLPELPVIAGVLTAEQSAATAASIARAQQRSGAIPWFPGGHVDVWDHVEAAMGLTVAGRLAEADRAYAWLQRAQRPDGSWPIRIEGGRVVDAGADTNFVSYPAVGVWHHWLVTGDEGTLWRRWPMIRRALDFVLGLQLPNGTIAWAQDARRRSLGTALLSGCSSLYLGLRCGIAIAELVGDAQPAWELAAGRLGHTLLAHPELFEDKRRFSMDWYYPVLAGPWTGASAWARLAGRWGEFVVPGLGARCVADRPWVTGAETCELALAVQLLGDDDGAAELVRSMQHLRADDGSYWTGYVYDDEVRWPVERSTWTSGAVLLAADALSASTTGAGLFRGAGLPVVPEAREALSWCELSRCDAQPAG